MKLYSDKIILSSFYAKTQIGLFDFAKSQAESVNLFFLYTQIGIVTSYLSKHIRNTERLKVIFSSMGILFNSIIIPIMFYVFFTADWLLPLVLGTKWAGSIVFLKIFQIQAILKLILYPSDGILSPLGLPQLKAEIIIFFTIFSVPVLAYMAYIQLSLLSFAIVFVFVNVLSDVVLCFIGVNKIDISFFMFLKSKLNGVLAWLVLIIGSILITTNFPNPIWILTAFYFITISFNLKFISNQQIKNSLQVFLGQDHKITLIATKFL